MAKITYTNKVALNENPEIALINKVTDDDLNEIKSVVNTNDDNVGDLTNLTTTTKTNIVAAVNEINSNAASATDLGDISDLTTTDKTSAVNAINELNSDKAADNIILVQSTEPSSDTNILWINDGQIGTPASEITNSYSESTGIGYSANYVNNLHTYSNTEVRVGTWLGKPLYRKVLTLGALKNNGDTSVDFDSSFVIKKFDIYCVNPTNNIKFKLPIVGANYITQYISGNTIIVQTTSDRTAFTDNYVIIEYTKTTD